MRPSVNLTYLIAGLGFLGLAIFVGYNASQLRFYTRFGPGPGFFPLILAGIMGVLALAMMVQSVIRADDLPRGAFRPVEKGSYFRVGVLIAVLLVTAPLLNVVGYRVTMVGFYFVLLRVLGRRGTLMSAVLGVALSLGTYELFSTFLGVPLPRGRYGL